MRRTRRQRPLQIIPTRYAFYRLPTFTDSNMGAMLTLNWEHHWNHLLQDHGNVQAKLIFKSLQLFKAT